MKKLLIVLIFVFQFMFIGCAHVVSHVTSFHELPSNASSHTYKFLPLEGQKGSLEYEAYAKRISNKLESFNPVKLEYSEGFQITLFPHNN